MRIALVIPATLLGGSLAILSVAANFWFGYLLSTGQERWLYAFLFAVLDACKTFLLPWRDAFLENDDTKKAKWALRAFCIFALASFCAEFGLYKTVKAQMAAEAAAATVTVAAITDPKKDAEKKLEKLESTRARSEINKDIADKKLEPLWRRSKECRDVSLDDSREFCRGYNALNSELFRLEERETLQGEIRQADKQILAQAERGTLAKVGKQADVQAAAFARLLGLDATTVSDGLSLIIAFLVELGSVLLPWFAYSKARNAPVPVVPGSVLEAPAPAEQAHDSKDMAVFQPWYDAIVVKRRDGVVTADEVHQNHGDWWHLHGGQKPLQKTALGRCMRRRGHTGKKKGGVQKYFGIALRPVAKPKPRLAVSNQ